MFILRGEPDLFDLDAWKQRLAALQADPQSAYRDALIDDTQAQIDAIEDWGRRTPADAA